MVEASGSPRPPSEEAPLASLLDGIRVLDLSDWVAGSYCARILAEYGATVTKVESPSGTKIRAEGPEAGEGAASEGGSGTASSGATDGANGGAAASSAAAGGGAASGDGTGGDGARSERRLLHLHLNANKRSVSVEIEQGAGRELVRRLAAASEIVIEDRGVDVLERMGLGWEELSEGRDDLVMVSITPFGLSGPWRNYRGSELTLQAMGGPLHLNGTPEREPIKSGGYVGHLHAGISAAFAAMMLRSRVEGGGAGDRVDLAIYETQSGFRDRRTPSLMSAAYAGYAGKRQGGGIRVASGVRPVADGYVNILGSSPRYWARFLELIGRPDLNERPESKLASPQMPQEFVDEVEASYLTWLLQRTKQQVVMETQAIGALGGAIYTTEDLLTDPQYRGRGVWDEVDHPVAGAAEHAGRQLILSETPRAPLQPAPLLGQHNEAVLVGELGLEASELAELRSAGVVGAATEVPA